VEVLTDRGNLQGIPLQGLAPRKIPGVPDQSPGPDLNLGLDPEEALEDIIQGHDLGPVLIDAPVAGLTVEIIAEGIATVILPCLLEGVMLETGQILTPTVVLVCLA
jgi:hypothetical protein